MTWGMTAVAGSSLVSGVIGSRSAKKAAEQQAAAIREAAQIQERMFQQQRSDLEPYRNVGYTALGDITERMPFFTSQFGDEQMEQYLDPSMEFRRRLGEQTTARMLNVGGGAISGNTLRGLEEFGQNLASTEYGNAFNRFLNERTNIYNTLANIAGMGQGAVNTGVEASQQAASNLGQLAAGQGQVQAAGTVGATNALTGALQNAGNMYYLNQLMRPATPAVTPPPGYGTTGAPGMGGGTGLSYSPNMANQFFSAK
jgi:hypothetical protein